MAILKASENILFVLKYGKNMVILKNWINHGHTKTSKKLANTLILEKDGHTRDSDKPWSY